jgi:F-type H+-transporting ATPase subunit epsilon
MAEPTLHITVLTEEGTLFDGEAVSVVAPAETGYLGILAHHAPMLATLAQGTLIMRTPEQQTQKFQVGAGFIEVAHNQVTVLTGEWMPSTTS